MTFAEDNPLLLCEHELRDALESYKHKLFAAVDEHDPNCGEILDGAASVDEMGARIFRLILETASGRPSRSEALGFGDLEFIPWQIGAVM